MNANIATWIAIVGVALTTFITRGSFVVFATRLKLPLQVEQALRFAPAAALGAIVGPALLIQHSHIDLSFGNHRLEAAAIAALIMWRTHSMLGSIAGGMVVLTLLLRYG